MCNDLFNGRACLEPFMCVNFSVLIILRDLHAFGEMGCSRASPRSNPGLDTVRCFVLETSVILNQTCYHLETQ